MRVQRENEAIVVPLFMRIEGLLLPEGFLFCGRGAMSTTSYNLLSRYSSRAVLVV